MKIEVSLLVRYTWQEDSDNWPDIKDPTPEKMLDEIKEYIEGDHSYYIDCDPEIVSLEQVKDK